MPVCQSVQTLKTADQKLMQLVMNMCYGCTIEVIKFRCHWLWPFTLWAKIDGSAHGLYSQICTIFIQTLYRLVESYDVAAGKFCW